MKEGPWVGEIKRPSTSSSYRYPHRMGQGHGRRRRLCGQRGDGGGIFVKFLWRGYIWEIFVSNKEEAVSLFRLRPFRLSQHTPTR